MEYLSHFAERLKDLMIENSLIPRTLGNALGINRSTVTRYLNNTRTPSVATLVTIADYFNCTLDFLLGLEEESSTHKFKKCPPFSEQLKIILDYAKTNKYQLWKKISIVESTIYDWQRGDNEPSLGSIIEIAKKLELPVDFVVGRINL